MKNWTGFISGRLTIQSVYKDARKPRAICECACGAVIDRQLSNIQSRLTKSCGCLRREVLSKIKSTHGANRPGQQWPEYGIWCAMRNRCYNKNQKSYPDYGGRGIIVCDAWRNSFSAFIKDMGRRPNRKFTIERRDNAGNYEPANCYWATRLAQAQNKRNSVKLEFMGTALSISAWARRTGIERTAISQRLRLGWTIEQALTIPTTENRRKINLRNRKHR